MREFAKFGTGFWTSPAIQAMSDHGKLLAAYLISSPHSNQVGVFRMPTGYVQGDLGWNAATVDQAFAELSSKGFATRCGTTFWVVIHKALKHTPPENPNQVKHVRALVEQVPGNASIRAVIAQCLTDTWKTVPEDLIAWLNKPSPNPLPTVIEQRDRDREKKEIESPGAERAARSPRKAKTEIPSDFAISDRVRTWAERDGHDRLEKHLESFVAKVRKHGYRYVDWDEALMESVRENWAKLPAAPTLAIEWWLTASGITAKAREVGVTEGDPVRAKCRIAAILGDGPWVDHRNQTELRLIDEYRRAA